MWYADPEPISPIQFILVAEWMPDALAAAAKLDPTTRACTRVVSTAGDLSKAGKHKLLGLIQDARQACRRAGGGTLVLVDASGLGGQDAKVREGTLYQLAALTGARYERWAPEGHRSWSEVVISERRAQEAISAEDASLADPVPESVFPEIPDRPRRRGRGR